MSDTPKTWFDAIAAMAFAATCAALIGVLNRVGDMSHAVVRVETQLAEMRAQMIKSDSYESRITALESKIKLLEGYPKQGE